MIKNTNCTKLIKQMLGLTLAVGSGILAAQLINKKIHKPKETYQISVNFDDEYN